MLGAIFARTQGSDMDVPDPEQIRADFDAALAAEPESVADPEKFAFLQAMGLR
jgi:hypothetical protein